MSKLIAIASAVIADAIRRKVVWVVLVFAAIMALVAPSLPSYGSGVVQAVYREVAIALMFVAALVVSLSLASTRVPTEVERRTVFNVLTRDVRRWQYLVGTWCGMFAVVGVVVAGFIVVAMVVAGFTYGDPMPVLLQAALAVWLEMGVIMAFAVLMSSRVGVVTTIIGTLAFTFVMHTVGGLIAGPTEFVRDPVWYIPSFDVFDVINPVAHGGGYGIAYGGMMLALFAAWVVLLLSVATVAFSGRDL